MDFKSISYIIWLLVYVALFWMTPNKYRQYMLIAFGLAFIFLKAPLAGAVLVTESLFCYLIARSHGNTRWKLVTAAIALIFTAFILCKYYALKEMIVLPLGISYYTFRLIHYLQESYRQRIRKHNLVEFLAYMTFFPTYLVGPINLFPEFLNNLRRVQWDSSKFSYGLERMIYGYAQLIILGNFVVNYLLKNWIGLHFANVGYFTELVIHSIQLWLDLYIRFSAYSSIAIGLAAMTGFQAPENFNYPFLATNIREFWQRWHMSLTNWCREYIYTPIAATTRKPFLAIGATMITIGVWHELSLRYILWGVYHSIGIFTWEILSKKYKGIGLKGKAGQTIQKIAGSVFTILFVVMSFPVTTLINNFIINLLK